MKTKELVKLLMLADPTGEEECCIGNSDIISVERMPAYYDGCLQVLERDKTNPNYNVIGAKYVGNGIKINIVPYTIFENENLPITFENISQSKIEYYQTLIAKHRKTVYTLQEKSERDYFIEHMTKRLVDSEDFDLDEVEQTAREFFNANLSYKDPIPADIVSSNTSYIGRRNLQWQREIAVDFVGDKFIFRKIK